MVRVAPYVGLANRWFQPLTHLSGHASGKRFSPERVCKYRIFLGNYKELRTKFPVSRLSPVPEGVERAGRTRIFSGGIGDPAADLLRGIMILQFDFVPLSDIWHVMATNEKELLEGIREQE